MGVKKYFLKVPKGKNQPSENIGQFKQKEQIMKQLNLSRIISVLTAIVTVLTFVLHYAAGYIPAEYLPVVAGIQAAILAFTERVQGGASKS